MNCKKCGNKMADGARFCISCGAEHNANGELVIKSTSIDYNKTVMINDIPTNNNKIDYNKTMMANDVPHEKIDYNKTMMANDVSHEKIDYNKTMMASDIPQNGFNNINNSYNNLDANKNVNVKKKKSSPIIIIVGIVLIAVATLSIVLPRIRKNNYSNNISKSKDIDKDLKVLESESISETPINGNIVADFDNSSGYWSKDNEFFYKNGVLQKNQWVGDYYLGEDGRKVKNKLIDDTYYVDIEGKKVKNEWYKFQKRIGTGEVTVWYYLGPDGAKLRNAYSPDGYYVDKDGIYIQEENKTPDSKRYVPNN
ncbi:MAG: zinc-ribbon domain-containing protein [Lachnospiraceae bacterium]|nr:zinc-ribbon domain-containing protein [Lachnospiraceae bacterium]